MLSYQFLQPCEANAHLTTLQNRNTVLKMQTRNMQTQQLLGLSRFPSQHFVTASSGTAISTDMFRNFVKNSFKFDVALKHAPDEIPARKSTGKGEIAARDEQSTGDDKKDVPNAYRTRYCVYL